MSFTFGRPTILPTHFNVLLPNPLLDQPGENLDVPSPIVARILQFDLATNLPDHGISTLSSISFVKRWITTFPNVFDINDPDLRWDAQYPRLVFQRFQLHNIAYSTLLQLVRPYLLAHSRVHGSDENDAQLHDMIDYAIDTALKSMNAAEAFYQATYPRQARYFMIAFCPFETATCLCATLTHDDGTQLPRRKEMVNALGRAMGILDNLRGISKMGQSAWTILTQLISRLNLTDEERYSLKQGRKLHELPIKQSSGELDSSKSTDHGMREGYENLELEAELNTAQSSHVPDVVEGGLAANFLVQASWLDEQSNIVSQFDYNTLDGLWEWDESAFESLVVTK